MSDQEVLPPHRRKWVRPLLTLGLFILTSVVGILAVTFIETMHGITYPSSRAQFQHWLMLMAWGGAIATGQRAVDAWVDRRRA